MLRLAIVARQGHHIYDGFDIQSVNAYFNRLMDMMAPFMDDASKYLATFLGWRQTIERDGTSLTTAHAIADALKA